MTLMVKRNDGETWRDCTMRMASAWLSEEEINEDFDELIAEGESEADACFILLESLDMLDFDGPNCNVVEVEDGGES